jgi:hypothetical protein
MGRLTEALTDVRRELDSAARHAEALAQAQEDAAKLLGEIDLELGKIPPSDRQHIEVVRGDNQLSILRQGASVLTLRPTSMGLAVYYPGADTTRPPTDFLGEQLVFRAVAQAIEISKVRMPSKSELGGTVRLWD